MKNNFRGWTSVIKFTFRQSTKGASYKVVTILIALIIIGGIITANLLAAKPDDMEQNKPSPIEKV